MTHGNQIAPLLKSRRQLAAALGLARKTVAAMARAGCPTAAGRFHLDWTLQWLRDNPEFRACQFPKKTAPPKSEGAN
jgi:hypothetical protein